MSERPLLGYKLLIVEDFGDAGVGVDRASVFSSYTTPFRRAGATLDTRASVYQAQLRLRELRAQQKLPHALVSDFQLGSGNGVDLALWMASEPSFGAIPRVLITGTRYRAAQAAEAQGTTLAALYAAVYDKPVAFDIVITTLVRLLTTHREGESTRL